jgi:hypothetical protein
MKQTNKQTNKKRFIIIIIRHAKPNSSYWTKSKLEILRCEFVNEVLYSCCRKVNKTLFDKQQQ